jgi:hypothetical protein
MLNGTPDSVEANNATVAEFIAMWLCSSAMSRATNCSARYDASSR